MERRVAGGSGLMVEFAPGERHAVRALTTARLLLLLTPWPGDGHPGTMSLERQGDGQTARCRAPSEPVTTVAGTRLAGRAAWSRRAARAGKYEPAPAGLGACRSVGVSKRTSPERSESSDQRARSPLLEAHRFLRRGPVNAEGWSQLVAKDRDWERSYRGRWAHDKVVRSTHGVNCTGSCSWNVYVKDGLITWESQAVDYPVDGRGDAGVRAARLPARGVVLLVHVLAAAAEVPVRAREPAGDVPRGPGAARRPGGGMGGDRRRSREGCGCTRASAARAGSCAPRGMRRWR